MLVPFVSGVVFVDEPHVGRVHGLRQRRVLAREELRFERQRGGPAAGHRLANHVERDAVAVPHGYGTHERWVRFRRPREANVLRGQTHDIRPVLLAKQLRREPDDVSGVRRG